MQNIYSKYPHIKTVSSFDELVGFSFHDTFNALCFERNLDGDFEEIISKLELKDNITEVSLDDLLLLQLSNEGSKARDIMLNDYKLLSDFGASPSINLLKFYEKDDELDFISTDVYSFHVDHSPIETSTFLCTYFGESSDILPNDQALKKIDIPEIKEKLKNIYKLDDKNFDDFVKENFFDLHYQSKPNSEPINLGIGHIWRLSCESPNQKVLPCIHRAPNEKNRLRLLLIC